MLSSIHPLGERARNNKWWLTVTAFTLGALVAGAAVGAILGSLGSVFSSSVDAPTLLLATAGVAFIAGILDLTKTSPPGPARQVNETWIGAYRGWVYGGGFGLELGVGFATYIVTWSVYASYAAAFLTGSPLAGGLVGAVFGVGRSLTLILAGAIDRPSRLTTFNRALAKAGPVIQRLSAFATAGLGAALLITGMS